MELEHSFTVPVPPDQAWDVLLDVARVAPCLPGASVDAVEGDQFSGRVKVKVGPITVTYTGKGRFLERDAANHRAVLEARGKEMRGTGTASATVTTTLHDDGGSTRVDVRTDLSVTGKPAQFGRGVLADVGAKLIGQFANCLAEELAGRPEVAAQPEAAAAPAAETEAAPAAETTAAAEPAAEEPSATGVVEGLEPPAAPQPVASAPAPRLGDEAPRPTAEHRRTPDAIDLIGTAGAPVAKRLAPALAALAALGGILVLWRRRRR